MAIVPVARQLQRQGHRVYVAVNDLTRVPVDSAAELAFVQSPLWLHHAAGAESFGYADMLAVSGYAVATSLQLLVHGWCQLISLTQADLIVADHAPTALLAARAIGCAAVSMGTGFACPPPHAPLPGFTALTAEQKQRLQMREHHVLQNCNTVLAAYKAPSLAMLAELFAPSKTLLCTYPELDHYGHRLGVEYHGPLYSDAEAPPVAWPDIFNHSIFVYLNNFRDWSALQLALQRIQANILIVATGIYPDNGAFACAPHVALVNHPVNLHTVLQRSDLVICHGGFGTTANALAHAKPVLLLPTQKEQWMLAQRLAAQQLGNYLLPGFQPEPCAAAIDHLLNDQNVQMAVTAYAQRHTEPLALRVERIAQRIGALAGLRSG